MLILAFFLKLILMIFTKCLINLYSRNQISKILPFFGKIRRSDVHSKEITPKRNLIKCGAQQVATATGG